MPDRLRLAAWIMPLILFGEMLALGADSIFLGAAAAVLEIAGAILVIIMIRPDADFWRAFRIPLIMMVITLAWLASAGLLHDDVMGRMWRAPDLLFPGLMRFTGGCAMLMACAMVAWRRRGTRWSIDAWLILGLMQLAIALALRQWDADSVWGFDKGMLRDRFTGTFLNANAAGCLYAVLSILALGRGLSLWRDRLGSISMILLVVTPVALLGGIGACAITQSRTALAVCILALMALVLRFNPLSRGGQMALPPIIALVAGTACIAIILMLIGEGTVNRLAMVDQDGVGRWELWSFYAHLVTQAPLGYGPGGLDDAALQSFRSIGEARALWFVHSPHNVILSLLLTGGWPYLILMALLALSLAFPLRHRETRQHGPMLWSICVALIAIMLCASTDIALDMPAMASLAAMLAGWMWGTAMRARTPYQSLLTASNASTSAAAGEPATSPRA